jgi:predicted dehydrogenase
MFTQLPNGLHFEWTIKALLAGKHVLLEKPAANTAAETRQMFALAKERGLVLLEAFHYRFHPAIQRVKAILESGELGAVQSVRANMLTTKGIFTGDDIRFDYDLGGGAMMDMGCACPYSLANRGAERPAGYALCVTRYLGGEPTEVLAASHVERGPRVDRATDVHLALASGATARLACDLEFPAAFAGVVPHLPDWSVAATCEGGSVALTNFLMPVHWHSIVVTKADGTVRTEKAYTGAGKGEAWWSTCGIWFLRLGSERRADCWDRYRYQLEAFVDRLRGREPQHWFTEEDSVQNMHWIEQIYAKVSVLRLCCYPAYPDEFRADTGADQRRRTSRMRDALHTTLAVFCTRRLLPRSVRVR